MERNILDRVIINRLAYKRRRLLTARIIDDLSEPYVIIWNNTSMALLKARAKDDRDDTCELTEFILKRDLNNDKLFKKIANDIKKNGSSIYNNSRLLFDNLEEAYGVYASLLNEESNNKIDRLIIKVKQYKKLNNIRRIDYSDLYRIKEILN